MAGRKSFNYCAFTGNLVSDPKTISDNFAAFTIAVNGSKKVEDEWVDDPMFMDVNVFGNSASFVTEYLNKGSQVLVSGELKQDRWESSDGDKRSKHVLKAFNVQSIGAKAVSSDEEGANATVKRKTRKTKAAAAPPVGEDDF